jgi:hypothetical protein
MNPAWPARGSCRTEALWHAFLARIAFLAKEIAHRAPPAPRRRMTSAAPRRGAERYSEVIEV